jgi:hypothetical protein
MALDLLTIPTMLADAERIFSGCREQMMLWILLPTGCIKVLVKSAFRNLVGEQSEEDQ